MNTRSTASRKSEDLKNTDDHPNLTQMAVEAEIDPAVIKDAQMDEVELPSSTTLTGVLDEAGQSQDKDVVLVEEEELVQQEQKDVSPRHQEEPSRVLNSSPEVQGEPQEIVPLVQQNVLEAESSHSRLGSTVGRHSPHAGIPWTGRRIIQLHGKEATEQLSVQDKFDKDKRLQESRILGVEKSQEELALSMATILSTMDSVVKKLGGLEDVLTQAAVEQRSSNVSIEQFELPSRQNAALNSRDSPVSIREQSGPVRSSTVQQTAENRGSVKTIKLMEQKPQQVRVLGRDGTGQFKAPRRPQKPLPVAPKASKVPHYSGNVHQHPVTGRINASNLRSEDSKWEFEQDANSTSSTSWASQMEEEQAEIEQLKAATELAASYSHQKKTEDESQTWSFDDGCSLSSLKRKVTEFPLVRKLVAQKEKLSLSQIQWSQFTAFLQGLVAKDGDLESVSMLKLEMLHVLFESYILVEAPNAERQVGMRLTGFARSLSASKHDSSIVVSWVSIWDLLRPLFFIPESNNSDIVDDLFCKRVHKMGLGIDSVDATARQEMENAMASLVSAFIYVFGFSPNQAVAQEQRTLVDLIRNAPLTMLEPTIRQVKQGLVKHLNSHQGEVISAAQFSVILDRALKSSRKEFRDVSFSKPHHSNERAGVADPPRARSNYGRARSGARVGLRAEHGIPAGVKKSAKYEDIHLTAEQRLDVLNRDKLRRWFRGSKEACYRCGEPGHVAKDCKRQEDLEMSSDEYSQAKAWWFQSGSQKFPPRGLGEVFEAIKRGLIKHPRSN